MKTALIGHTGFVGSTLAQMINPTHRYRSTDIDTIRGESFDHVICAGVQAVKWWANKEPEADWQGIRKLLDALAKVKARRFTLLSTIDVYPSPRGVDESTLIDWEKNHAYGRHRFQVEQWIQNHFPDVTVLRLPGLFGPNLKKNVIFDLINNNELDKVHPGGVFQYYDTRRLAKDIEHAWDRNIRLLNLATEPLGTAEIQSSFFPDRTLEATGPAPQCYDMHTLHAAAWGRNNGYLYSKDQVLADLGDWLGIQGSASNTHESVTS